MKKSFPIYLLIAAFHTSLYAQSNEQDTFRIAVICHIIHQGQAVGVGSNISAAQVRSQFIVLNEDFNRRNRDTVNTPAVFKGVAAAMPIYFAPAKISPTGTLLSEPGINRIRVQQTRYNYADIEALQKIHAWDPDKYLNVYVLSFVDGLSNLAGFATYPSRSTLSDIPIITFSNSKNDGIVVETEFFGSNYTSEGNSFSLRGYPHGRGRVMIHEVGHYLGLVHVWGNGDCSRDDGVDDTPTAAHPNRSGTTPPCNQILNSCGADVPGDLPDMYQNYMDYSGDVCMNLFTEGQKKRMVTALKKAQHRKNLDRNFLSVAILGSNRDSIVLAELYNRMNGNNWSRPWNLKQPFHTWAGVTIKNQRVVELNLHNNRLEGTLPENIKYLDSLEVLNLSSNYIHKLVDLTAMAKLNHLEVQNNYLDFKTLKSNLIKLKNLKNYNPQNIRTGKLYIKSKGENLRLQVRVDGSGNTYQWYKNKLKLAGDTNSILQLENIQNEAEGYYHCEVSHPDLPDLKLLSEPDTLTVGYPPVAITLSKTEIFENKPIGTEIGRLTTSDLDSNDRHAYSLSGLNADSFKIVDDRLQSAVIFNFETQNKYQIRIKTTDRKGLSFERWAIISIIDLAETVQTTPTALPANPESKPQQPILIYPNPSSGSIKITGLDKVSKLDIQILSLKGEVLKTYTQVQASYDLSDLPRGFYIALIQADDQTEYLTFGLN